MLAIEIMLGNESEFFSMASTQFFKCVCVKHNNYRFLNHNLCLHQMLLKVIIILHIISAKTEFLRNCIYVLSR